MKEENRKSGRDITDYKKSEEELLHKTKELETIFKAIPDLFFRLDEEGNIINYYAGEKSDLYVPPEVFMNKTFQDVLPANVANMFKQAIRKVKKTHLDQTVEYSLNIGGTERYFEGRVLPLDTHVIIVIRNITERRKSGESLRESRERFRGLVETTSDWIWEVDENAVYTYVSPKISDILGYGPEEVLGKTPFSLMPPDEAKRIAAIFAPIAASQKPFRELENTNIHKDGHLVVLETSGVPIINMDGKFCGYRGIDRDITDRKEAEDTLRIRAEELKESNIALKVLLKQRENDKSDLEEKILSNIKHIIMPYIEKLKKNRSMSEELVYLNILESNIKEIVSPFSSKLSFKYLDFTPKEIMMANLILDGKQDKDMADLLNISIDTVKFHRKNIRKKLDIYGKRINLRSHLLSILK